ncbi:MAG: 23S rRNA (pseudouridine(1915)-N(3))-methyltransferase RlmH [Eubacteriales bacterium]|nr:23S rRNA (pseudouridine(1915)-N(3))-methyltransferase RlmH [Eubacteriales bacterium]
MRLDLICVGQLKERYLRDAYAEYAKRLGRYVDFHCVEIKDCPDRIPDLRAKAEEAAGIIAKVPAKSYVIAMDERGQQMDSLHFSELLFEGFEQGQSQLSFIIGGSRGLDDSLRQSADALVSMGKMTMSHQIFRIVLLEQIYRAFKIHYGEPYHK